MQIQTAHALSPLRGQIYHRQPASLGDVFKGQAVETFSLGEAIFWEGDRADNVFEIMEGVLRVCRLLSDGRRAIVGFIHPGEVLGVSFRDSYLFTAEAVTKVKLRRFGRARFLAEVTESPELRPQLLSTLCDEMSAAQDQMLLLGRKGAEERVASFLLAILAKAGRDDKIELPMTRLDMADYLGLTIETVSRMMTKFMRRGLIASTGRHSLILQKVATLRKIAGSDEDTQLSAVQPRRAVWPH